MTDISTFATAPVDPTSRERLAGSGLDYRAVDAASDDYPGWLRAVARGFHGAEPSADETTAGRARNTHKRLIGVFDASSADPATAVATVASWGGALTLPGGEIDAWAISAVTVAQTHRRRGVARALLEGELRAAHGAGAPIAMLTVSESTLYGRYGFASAASAAILDIDTRRVRWTGPEAPGRLDFVSRETARELVVQLHDEARRRAPGDISLPPGHEDRYTGTAPDAKHGADIRCVQYVDVEGRPRGVVTYTISEHERDNTKSTAKVVALIAATDDAYAALWRFLFDLDLVAHVRAELQSVDEPVLWMFDDRRAAGVAVFDHQYLRILDVPAVLTQRRYAAAGALVLDVRDPLGITTGEYLLRVDDGGVGTVTAVDGVPADAVRVVIGVAELSALSLGGVSASALARAGRIDTSDALAVARLFTWPVTPRLSLWY